MSTFGFTGFACYLPRICGCIAPMGDFPIADASEGHEDRYGQSRVAWRPTCIVVWGNEPLASNADGYMGHWLAQCVQMGSKIISIDPRLTWWGARAEYWLHVRPGTDARAWPAPGSTSIINEDLYDHEFVDCWCAGFDELAASVQECHARMGRRDLPTSPQRTSSGLGTSVRHGTSPAAIQWGLAIDQQLSRHVA